MSFTDRMTPKLRAIRARLPEAIADLNRGNARAILAASQPLVPVDTGALKRSGRVEPAREGETVIKSTTSRRSDPRGITAQKGGSVLVYGGGEFTNPRTKRQIDYAGYVHYRLDVNHPVGQAQFVGQPLRTERAARKQATARAMRKWLKKGI